MASVIREISIDAHPDTAWSALREWGAVHQRLVPGFLLGLATIKKTLENHA